jgi:hypothetical protein
MVKRKKGPEYYFKSWEKYHQWQKKQKTTLKEWEKGLEEVLVIIIGIFCVVAGGFTYTFFSLQQTVTPYEVVFMISGLGSTLLGICCFLFLGKNKEKGGE